MSVKVDNEFIANFIKECAQNNKTSVDDICKEASDRIIEIEKLLKLKEKFQGVLKIFNKKIKKTYLETNIKDNLDAKQILNWFSDGHSFSTKEIIEAASDKQTYIFLIKKLIEDGYLTNSNGILKKGVKYEIR